MIKKMIVYFVSLYLIVPNLILATTTFLSTKTIGADQFLKQYPEFGLFHQRKAIGER